MIEKVEFLTDGVPDPKLVKRIRQDPNTYKHFLNLADPVTHYGIPLFRAQELADTVLGLYYYGPLSGEPFPHIDLESLPRTEQYFIHDALEYCSLD